MRLGGHGAFFGLVAGARRPRRSRTFALRAERKRCSSGACAVENCCAICVNKRSTTVSEFGIAANVGVYGIQCCWNSRISPEQRIHLLPLITVSVALPVKEKFRIYVCDNGNPRRRTAQARTGPWLLSSSFFSKSGGAPFSGSCFRRVSFKDTASRAQSKCFFGGRKTNGFQSRSRISIRRARASGRPFPGHGAPAISMPFSRALKPVKSGDGFQGKKAGISVAEHRAEYFPADRASPLFGGNAASISAAQGRPRCATCHGRSSV